MAHQGDSGPPDQGRRGERDHGAAAPDAGHDGQDTGGRDTRDRDTGSLDTGSLDTGAWSPEPGQGGEGSGGYEVVGDRLTAEFEKVHHPETVARCVAAARHGAEEVTGAATPDLVERIARKHLQVLAVVAAERRRQAAQGTRGAQGT